MDEQIKPIQLPVRYDKTACQLVDAAEAAWLDVDALDYDDRDICEAMVKQIAAALNATRREAALVEALEHYGNEDNWICGNENCYVESGACGHVMDVYAGQSGNGNVIAQTALKAYKGDKSDEAKGRDDATGQSSNRV